MYNHIMVPLDGSELAECVLPHVIFIAKADPGRQITLVRVVTPITMYSTEIDGGIAIPEFQKVEELNMANAQAYLDKQVKYLAENGVKAGSHVIFGNVPESLTDFAEKNKVDLIVIATHGRSGLSRWVWGSVADRILRSAKAPIMMIRPEGAPKHGI